MTASRGRGKATVGGSSGTSRSCPLGSPSWWNLPPVDTAVVPPRGLPGASHPLSSSSHLMMRRTMPAAAGSVGSRLRPPPPTPLPRRLLVVFASSIRARREGYDDNHLVDYTFSQCAAHAPAQKQAYTFAQGSQTNNNPQDLLNNHHAQEPLPCENEHTITFLRTYATHK